MDPDEFPDVAQAPAQSQVPTHGQSHGQGYIRVDLEAESEQTCFVKRVCKQMAQLHSENLYWLPLLVVHHRV